MTHGAGCRIAGRVKRKAFVVPSGKVAFLTIEVDYERDGVIKKKSIEMKTFDCVVEVGSLREGDEVEVTGSVDSEQPKNKDRTPVQMNGRDMWCPSLTIRVVKGAPPPPPKPPMDESDVGF